MIDIACDPRHFFNQRDRRRKSSACVATANTHDYPSNTLDYPLNTLDYFLNPDIDQNACSLGRSSTFTPEMKYQAFSTSQSSNSNQASLTYATCQPPNPRKIFCSTSVPSLRPPQKNKSFWSFRDGSNIAKITITLPINKRWICRFYPGRYWTGLSSK